MMRLKLFVAMLSVSLLLTGCQASLSVRRTRTVVVPGTVLVQPADPPVKLLPPMETAPCPRRDPPTAIPEK